MADQFQIPQRTPPEMSFQQPDLNGINALYNRQQPAEYLADILSNISNQQYQRNIQQQQLKAGAFEAGGPYLMQALYGPHISALTTPPGTIAGQVNGPDPSIAMVGTSPSDGSNNAPTQPQQMQGQQSQPQPDSQISNPIQHSVQNMGAPDFSGHLSRIQDLQNKMNQANNLYGSSKWGLGQQKMYSDLLSAEKSAMDAEQLPSAYQKTQNEIAMQPTELDLKKQQLANAEQQIPMEKNKTIAGEASKLSQQKTEVKTLQGMFDNLDKNLHSYYSDPKSFVGSGNLQKITKGRMGSASGGNVINQGKPLVAAVNQLLTHRFNMAEGQLLSDSIAPSPNDTPQYAASKMKMMHQIIQAMDAGNRDNITNVIQAINGQTSGLQQ